MREHRGYPIALGGSVKYIAKRLGVRSTPPSVPPAGDLLHDDASDEVVSYSVDALATRLELAILQKAKPRDGTGAELALRRAMADDAQFYSALMAFRSDDDDGVVEFEFGAVGYPGTYTKRVRLTGLVGERPVTRTPFETDDEPDDEP